MSLRPCIPLLLAFAASSPSHSQACSLRAWSGPNSGQPVVGRPTDVQPVVRYTGECAVAFPSSGIYLRDGAAEGEARQRVRFYVFTGLTSGNAVIYRALDPGSVVRIEIRYSRDTNAFVFGTSSSSGTIGSIVQDRWYSIEFDWSRSSAAMNVVVRGAGATVDSTVSVGGVLATDQIDSEQIGWISGSGTASSKRIIVDGYEARASTAIGRLCRGDANDDGTRNSGDQITARNEPLFGVLSPGQPDANEDGAINSGDQIVIRNIFLAGQGACSSGV